MLSFALSLCDSAESVAEMSVRGSCNIHGFAEEGGDMEYLEKVLQVYVRLYCLFVNVTLSRLLVNEMTSYRK